MKMNALYESCPASFSAGRCALRGHVGHCEVVLQGHTSHEAVVQVVIGVTATPT